MKTEIKRVCIWDDQSQQFYPDDPGYFFAMIDMDIGPAGSEGGDIFTLTVRTRRWFEKNIMISRPNEPTHETGRKTSTKDTIYSFTRMTRMKLQKNFNGLLTASEAKTEAKIRGVYLAIFDGTMKIRTNIAVYPNYFENAVTCSHNGLVETTAYA